jgi:alkanesulfonate monooxygenase SsuD/methylene tetrahydromethanopterin reductase-like flavin-dependent oxidoreductase (luciferase family)
MDVGIGLPNAVPGTTGARLSEWARRADARGFSSLGTIDRVVYDNYEPLIALAAAAAVTERIGLCTAVLLAPLRTNATELAKQALSVNALSGGRFTLGIGLGAREDDYEASGVELAGRGKRVDEMLKRIREVWNGGEIGPRVAGSPGLVVGGHADASYYSRRSLRRRLDSRQLGARAVRGGRTQGEGRLVRGGAPGKAADDGAGLLLPWRQR